MFKVLSIEVILCRKNM